MERQTDDVAARSGNTAHESCPLPLECVTPGLVERLTGSRVRVGLVTRDGVHRDQCRVEAVLDDARVQRNSPPGDHQVGTTCDREEHVRGLGLVLRLPEDCSVEDHRRIGAEGDRSLVCAYRQGLLSGEPHDHTVRILAWHDLFVDSRSLNGELETGHRQQETAAR